MITRRNQRVTSSAAQALLLLLVLGCRMLLLDPSIVMGESAAAASSSASAQNRRSLKVMEPFTVETKPAYRAVKEPVSSEDVSLSDQRTDSTVAMLKVPNLVAPPREDCSASGPCELCTDSDRDNTPECLETGRRQSFLCFVQESDEADAKRASHSSSSSSSSSSRTVYRSCPRTVDDEEFLLVRFQVFCFLTGAIAFMSVRKQKAAAASLFDQRKLNLQKRRSNDQMQTSSAISSGNVEMTSTQAAAIIRMEETKALVSSSSDTDGLDIV